MADPDLAALFGEIYAVDGWLGGSGLGSVPEATVVYRQVLQRLLDAGDVRSVVDAGCGDWQVARLLDWSGVSYIGIDVVPEVVRRNQAEFGCDHIQFRTGDISRDELPRADLLVSKDVLQHLPNASVSAFLARATGRYRYLLLTNDVATNDSPAELLNTDIAAALWRTLDIRRPPFDVPADWSVQYDVEEGRWTKCMVLSVRAGYRAVARRRPGSALRRVSRWVPPGASSAG